MATGWYNKGSAYQSKRHALAAQGVNTKPVNLTTFGFPAMGRPTPEQEEKEIQESKRQSEMTVKQTGEAIVDRLKAINHPLIKSVVLDDYASYSGQVFVTLKAHVYDAIYQRKYILGAENLPEGKKFNIRTVTNAIRKALAGYNIEFEQLPERTYEVVSGKGWSEKNFDGYDKDYIKIGYEI